MWYDFTQFWKQSFVSDQFVFETPLDGHVIM